jgi:hypothetical protein
VRSGVAASRGTATPPTWEGTGRRTGSCGIGRRGCCLCQQVPKSSSRANPNNRNRHRQAGGEGADDRQGECEKRIYVRSQIVYRHSLTPLRAHKSKSRTGTNALPVPPLATRVQKRELRWCADMVNERLNGKPTWSSSRRFRVKALGTGVAVDGVAPFDDHVQCRSGFVTVFLISAPQSEHS